MWERSRDLRASAVSALAKVAVVWLLAVLGAVFVTTTAAVGDVPDSDRPVAEETSGYPGAPRTAGLVLVLALLGGGALVLTVGSARTQCGRRPGAPDRYDGLGEDFADDLPLALGLGLGFTGKP